MDLTGDDREATEEEELRKALSLSLGEVALRPQAEASGSNQLPVHGPAPPGDTSNSWALVPVIQDQGWNNNVKSTSDDAELARAMEASMAQSYNNTGFRPLDTARGDTNRFVNFFSVLLRCLIERRI